jgi:undecaprenyl-diphosphatase
LPLAPDGPRLPVRQAVLLGLVHGPAELAPISSSAHTTLLAWQRRWRYGELDPAARKRFEVALHAGTALALLIVPGRGLGTGKLGVVLLACVPPALAGRLLQGPIERRFGTPPTIAAGLLGGSVVMVIADLAGGRTRGRSEAGAADGIALGLAQAIALIPGVSRSGVTRAAARWRGFSPIEADALSSAVGMPITLGALALKGKQALESSRRGEWLPLSAGALAAFSSTLISGSVTRQLGRSRSLLPYAAYRVVVAAAVIRRLRQNGSDDRRLRRGRR